MTHKITFARLRSIIAEEINRAILEEKSSVDAEQLRKETQMKSGIADLVDAINKFQNQAGINVTNALVDDLARLQDTINMIVKSPEQYLDRPPRTEIVYQSVNPKAKKK
jgi:hypothetical protein